MDTLFDIDNAKRAYRDYGGSDSLELYPRIDESKVNSIIDNIPLISDLRKTFYKQMLHYRKELILDRAYQVLQKRQEVINEDFTLLATSII